MKFLFPSGEEKEITLEFIAQHLNLDLHNAKLKLQEFRELLCEKSYTEILHNNKLFNQNSDTITFECLATVIFNYNEEPMPRIFASYDYPQEAKDKAEKERNCIRQLYLLLYKSNEKYFKDQITPSCEILKKFFKINIDPLLSDEGKLLIKEKKIGNELCFDIDDIKYTINIGKEFEKHYRSRPLRSIQEKFGICAYMKVDIFTTLVIPWFYIPHLNVELKKLELKQILISKKFIAGEHSKDKLCLAFGFNLNDIQSIKKDEQTGGIEIIFSKKMAPSILEQFKKTLSNNKINGRAINTSASFNFLKTPIIKIYGNYLENFEVLFMKIYQEKINLLSESTNNFVTIAPKASQP